MTHPFLTEGEPSILAHRGASAERPPGNTLAAFRRAVDRGCGHLETDVQVSSDGVVVIFHDGELGALTTGEGRVGDWRWSDLESLRYVVDGARTDEGLARLDHVLEALPECFFNIDVKTDAAVEPTVDLLRRAARPERVCVASFSRRRLQRLRRALGSRWCFAFAKNEIVVARLATWLRLPVPRFGDVIQVPERRGRFRVVDESFVAACHESNVAVHVWTVDDRSTARRLRAMGVDGVITDDPAHQLAGGEAEA